MTYSLTNPVTDTNPLPVKGVSVSSSAWTSGATPQDLSQYGSAEMQVNGLSGGDTIAVTRSIDSTNYVPVSWIDQGFNVPASSPYTITADGIYSFPGGGLLKWTKTGVASTPVVTIRASS